MDSSSKNIWSTYAPLFHKFTPTMTRTLLSSASEYSSGKLLDLGCGSGKLWGYLNTPEIDEVIGIERNSEMVQLANQERRNLDFSVEIIKTDLNDYQPGSSEFNTVTSLNVLYTQPDLQSHIDLMLSGLSNSGKLILSSPHNCANMSELEKLVDNEFSGEEYDLFKQCNHYLASQAYEPKLYSLDEVCTLLSSSGLKIIEANEVHYSGHNFFVVAEKS